MSPASDLIGSNVFAYCSNNPVMRSDPSGHSWLGIAAVCLGVAAVCALAVVAAPVIAVAAAGAGIIVGASSIATAAATVGMAACAVGIFAGGMGIADALPRTMYMPRIEVKSDTKTKTKDITIPKNDNPSQRTYLRAKSTYPGAKVYVDQPIDETSAKMILGIGGDVYAKTAADAEYLCTITGGGFAGPTNDGNLRNAMHYHTIAYAGRGHVFFGYDPNLDFVSIMD